MLKNQQSVPFRLKHSNPTQKYPPLTIDDIKKGCKAALNTAEELISDAEILLKKKRYARAFFLTTIAIEEIGKYIMLCGMILRLLCHISNWKEFWKRYRNHKAKIGSIWSLFSAFFSKEHPSHYEMLKSIIRYKRNIVSTDSMKMLSLYSDYSRCKFIEPKQVIDAELTKLMMKYAKYMLKVNKRHYRCLVLYRPDGKQLAEFLKKTGFDKVVAEIKNFQKQSHYSH